MVWETRPRDSEVRRGEAESELRSDWQAEARPTKAVRAALGWTGRRPIPQRSDEESMSCEEVSGETQRRRGKRRERILRVGGGFILRPQIVGVRVREHAEGLAVGAEPRGLAGD